MINKYELDETGLAIHRFSRNVDWFEYIFHNRRAEDHLDSDVVIGPIANDTIFDTLGIISSGYLKPGDALKLLLIGPEYIQIAIKTEKAAKHLRFIGAEKIEQMDENCLKAEQDEYLELFARELAILTDEEQCIS